MEDKKGLCEEYRVEHLKKEAAHFRRQFERKRRAMVLEYMEVQDQLVQATALFPPFAHSLSPSCLPV
jgi:hypothetical protein